MQHVVALVGLAVNNASVASPPPLTSDQHIALEVAQDNEPISDDAGLVALLENVMTWDPDSAGDHAIVSCDDLSRFVESPALHRGDFLVLAGAYPRRVAKYALGYEYLDAWQIGSTPAHPQALVLIDTRAHSSDVSAAPTMLTVPVRFYKTIAVVDVNSNEHGASISREVPVFVGTHPTFRVSGSAPWSRPLFWVALVLLTGMMLVVWVKYKRSPTGGERIPLRGVPDPSSPAPEPNLPTDRAKALAELRRRADNTAEHE